MRRFKEKPGCHPLLAFKYFSSKYLDFCITLFKIFVYAFLIHGILEHISDYCTLWPRCKIERLGNPAACCEGGWGNTACWSHQRDHWLVTCEYFSWVCGNCIVVNDIDNLCLQNFCIEKQGSVQRIPAVVSNSMSVWRNLCERLGERCREGQCQF